MTVSSARAPQWCVDAIENFRDPQNASPEQIADLALRLSASGEVLERDSNAVDVASTGGPASLTTFIPPLILAASGARVLKIGVPGRPAGVIDTLGVVPGYRTELTRHEFTEAVAQSGFGNTLATGVFAPDDGILFKARQKLGAQNIPSLVIASLLSKKLSAGLTRAVFDVRTMDGGNFGANLSEAETNIRLLQRTATLLGIDVRCAPSDGRVPSQPMLGRAEALRGLLSLLNNSASPWLERHFETCVRLAVLADERAADGQHDRKGMRSVLDRHFRAQGADGLTAAEKYLEEVERTHLTSLVTVPSDGVISWDTVGLRTAITDSQSALKGTRAEAFPDSCGVELLRNTGDVVEAGIPVARVRGQNSEIMKKTMEGVARSMTITAQERDSNTGDSV